MLPIRPVALAGDVTAGDDEERREPPQRGWRTFHSFILETEPEPPNVVPQPRAVAASTGGAIAMMTRISLGLD